MINGLLSYNAWIEQPVIVALLRYFAEVAAPLQPQRHYLIVNPEFTHLIYSEVTDAASPVQRQPMALPNGATYGRLEGSDYVLLPIHVPYHWTIAIGSSRTGVFELFEPLQSHATVSEEITAKIVKVLDALRAGGVQVSTKQCVCFDAAGFLQYPPSTTFSPCTYGEYHNRHRVGIETGIGIGNILESEMLLNSGTGFNIGIDSKSSPDQSDAQPPPPVKVYTCHWRFTDS